MIKHRLDSLSVDLKNYLAELPKEYQDISAERKKSLLELSNYIRHRKTRKQPIQITVICTHNSRRSHIGQIWLQVAAYCYGIENFQSFSGGTEATAFNANAVAAMQRTGLQIEIVTKSQNPIYRIHFSEAAPSFEVFSKLYQADSNPSDSFAAVMVCTSADEACPMVIGADARFSLPFDDPKAFDGTALETTKYDERSRQIAREFFFVMSQV